MTLWKWSQNADTNANADSTINFAEGQSPRSLNNSSRALMAAVAKYHADQSGRLLSTGTATAYAVTTNQGFSSLSDGQHVSFTAHVTNGESPTLNVDRRGALPLVTASGVAVPPGTLVAGTPYKVTFSDAGDEWILHGFFSVPYAVPIGGFMPFISSTVPNSNFVLPYGQAISRTTYAELWALMGSPDTGDGNTTFTLPDIRGRTIFGLDNMGGSAAGRITTAKSGIDGTAIGASGGAQTRTLARSALPDIQLGGTTSTSGNHTHTYTGWWAPGSYDPGGSSPTASGTQTTSAAGAHQHSITTESINGGVTQTEVNFMPPSIVLPWLLRVI